MTARTTVIQIRVPARDDAAAVAELLNICSVADHGAPEYTPGEIRREWEAPDMNLEADTRIAVSPEGRVVGFMEFWDDFTGTGQRLYAFVSLYPDYADHPIGDALWGLAEERARQSSRSAPPDAPQRLKTSLWSSSAAARSRLERRGWRRIRHSFQMQRDFDTAPETPEWPEGIGVREFVRGQDEEVTFAVRQETYADMWDFDNAPFSVWKHHLIETNPDFDPAFWFLATEGDEVVGMTLCDAHTSEDAEMGWVKSVGVRRDWRRRGIASALLRHAFGEFYRRGTRKVALSVDAESLTGAQRIYSQAGMRAVRRKDIYEKDIPSA